MGRTTPSFRIAHAMEEWKPFREALDKSEKKNFGEMWDIAKLYISTCSNSVQLVPLHPIIISILFHHCKELKDSTEKVEQLMMGVKVNNSTTMMEKEKPQQEEMIPTTSLYGLFLIPNHGI